MASPIRKKDASVVERLASEPHRYSFFQAVRLLTAAGGARTLGAADGKIGTTERVTSEAIRFITRPTLQFPAAEILSIQTPTQTPVETEGVDHYSPTQPITVEVSFWGLIGPTGALPNHYTQLVIDRQRQRDYAMRDFFDLFSHRQLSLFYRAWEKHYVAAGFESANRERCPDLDRLRESLLAIVGLGIDSVRERFDYCDEARLYYGGHFIDAPNAESLTQMLGDYLQVPVEIDSLHGQWLRLPPSEQSELGNPLGHCRLGIDTTIGERVWDANSKFRIELGPVTYQDFKRLMPTGDRLRPLCQLVRSYTGAEFDFDVQVILTADEVPSCQLGDRQAKAAATGFAKLESRLGWNTWLKSRPMGADCWDAVFQHAGTPNA